MMYESKLALAIKHAGRVLREDKDVVYLPFGSEYSLFVKNLNTKRALVKISIDGTDICSGGFVVNANDSIDIERFVNDNNQGNRFKFIERSDNIEKSRGVGIEDGLIRVEFQFEMDMMPVLTWNGVAPNINDWRPPQQYTTSVNHASTDNSARGILRSSSANVGATMSATSMSVQSKSVDVNTNDAGITVPGSISDQKFRTVASFPLESTKHVMVLKLLGVDPNEKPVEAVKPSRQKQKCVTCSRVNKASAKFCTECGTNLTVI